MLKDILLNQKSRRKIAVLIVNSHSKDHFFSKGHLLIAVWNFCPSCCCCCCWHKFLGPFFFCVCVCVPLRLWHYFPPVHTHWSAWQQQDEFYSCQDLLSLTTSIHWDYCVRKANINSCVSLQDGWLAPRGTVKDLVPWFGASVTRHLLNSRDDNYCVQGSHTLVYKIML